jgi:hypothetical protein
LPSVSECTETCTAGEMGSKNVWMLDVLVEQFSQPAVIVDGTSRCLKVSEEAEDPLDWGTTFQTRPSPFR